MQLIDIAREYFGLSGLEKPTEAGGFLSVHIGDALSQSATVPGGFAGKTFNSCLHACCAIQFFFLLFSGIR